MSSLIYVKTIRSYTGLSRFVATLSEAPECWLARVQVEEIPSPYLYSPTVRLFNERGTGRLLCWFETSHKKYQAFHVSPLMLRFKTEQAAEDWHIRFSKKRVSSVKELDGHSAMIRAREALAEKGKA